MTTPSGNQLAVGARKGYVFPLNSAGLPAASSTACYEGLEIVGLKAADLQIPDPRVIQHGGNDRLLATDFLPSMEAITGEIRTASLSQDMNAALSNVSKFSVGEVSFIPWGTDQQGSEIDVAFLVFQQSLDTTSKVRRWRNIIAPRVRAIPILSGMSEQPNEQRMRVVASPTNTHLWGTALEEATEGALEMTFAEGMSEYKPKIVAWKADGTEDNFLFPTAYQAQATAKIKVWDNGTVVTPTLATSGVTFAVAPTTGHIVVALYEYA